MSAPLPPGERASLTRYAAAAATCADRYARTFYPMIRDADEKYVCCVHGAEAMQHHRQAAELLAAHGVDLSGLVERPLDARGLPGSDGLAPEGGESWPGRAVFSALVERAMVLQLRGLSRSEHAAVAEWARAALPRQEKHAAHGLWLIGRLCSGGSGGSGGSGDRGDRADRADRDRKVQAQAALDRLWPLAAALAGDEDATARSALLDSLRSALEPLGLSLSGLANPPA